MSENPIHLHAAVLRHRQKQVEDLRGEHVFGRIEKQAVDVSAPRLEIPFQLCSAGSDLICALESVHALGE